MMQPETKLVLGLLLTALNLWIYSIPKARTPFNMFSAGWCLSWGFFSYFGGL